MAPSELRHYDGMGTLSGVFNLRAVFYVRAGIAGPERARCATAATEISVIHARVEWMAAALSAGAGSERNP
jgi:hypothetical protein